MSYPHNTGPQRHQQQNSGQYTQPQQSWDQGYQSGGQWDNQYDPHVAPQRPPQRQAPPPDPKKKWPYVLGGVAAVIVLSSALNSGKGSSDRPTQAAAALPTVTYSAKPPTLEPVAAGPKEPIAVPANLKGQNMAVVLDVLQKSGFTNVRPASGDKYDALVVLPENWTVTKVSVKEGNKIPADTLIVVTGTKQ